MNLITNDLKEVINGINKSADVIISTMGGSGKNVILANPKDINFTKDGVSVARKIKFDNTNENIGSQLLINAANKTVNECGDGTTLTSLFIKEFANYLYEYFNNPENKDINKTIEEIKEGIEEIKVKLNANASIIENNDDIYKIALTSSKSEKVANLIKEIYKKTGTNALITVELSSNSTYTYEEITEGLSFQSGYIHSGFANQQNNTCSFENPYIAILDEPMVSPDEFTDIIEELYNKNESVVFIAPNFSDAFVRFCLSNVKLKGLKCCLVKTPGYGFYQKENIKDINAFTLSNRCNKVVISPDNIILYNNPDKGKINKRINQLQKASKNTTEKYDADDYINRIHSLEQSSAIIYVGGITEKNANEEYDRIEDAVGAVKSALVKGYVRGAGVELANIKLDSARKEMLEYIIQRPYFQILSNGNISTSNISDIPFNLKTKRQDSNIIDPVSVIENALDNAFALIELLINTSYIIYNND
jgi:chaperonin GroEL